MKLCDKHWQLLRSEVERAGMTHLAAPDAKAAHANMVGQLDGEKPKDTFDPLMNANFAIMGAALEQGGLYMMSGERCPVCEAMKHMAKVPLVEGGEPVGEAWVEQHWTRGPVEAQLEQARSLGLMPKVQ